MIHEISDTELDRVSGGQGNGATVIHQDVTTVYPDGTSSKEVFNRVITPSGIFNEQDILIQHVPKG